MPIFAVIELYEASINFMNHIGDWGLPLYFISPMFKSFKTQGGVFFGHFFAGFLEKFAFIKIIQ